MTIPTWSTQQTNLRNLLTAVFPTLPEALSLVEDAGMSPGDINQNGKVRDIWHSVVREAMLGGQESKLVEAALQRKPDLPALKAAVEGRFLERVSPLPIENVPWNKDVPEGQLEKIMGDQSTLLDVCFLEVGVVRAQAVARISVPGKKSSGDAATVEAKLEFGTGFLLAGNWLVTNHHVIATAEEARVTVVEFNFEKSARGLDKQPKSFKLDPDNGFRTSGPADKTNDWTVVKVAGDPEAEFGAIRLVPKQVAAKSRVNIIQHPGGGRKQVALSHNLVTYAGADQIQYLTDTLPGSSGSPVFDEDWDVVAVHASGGHMREPGVKTVVYRNAGIPIQKVIDGVKDLIGAT